MDYHAQQDAVKEISELALGVITLVQRQRAKRSADIIRRLVHHACMVVCAIIYDQATADKTVVGVRKDYQNKFQELVNALSAIKNFAEKRASQNAFIRVVKHVFYLKRIQEFRDDLERILGLFGLSSSNLIEQTSEQIASQLKTTLKELASMKQEGKASLHKEPHSTPTTSMAIPIYNRQGPGPAYIRSTKEQYTERTIGGDQTNVNTATYITSVNSGNTVTTITENSNNRRLYYADISTV